MYQRANFAYGTVLTPPSPAASGTSIVLQTGEGAYFPNTSGGTYICVVKETGTPATPANSEVVLVTSHDPANDTFTITREQESSSARTVIEGDDFYLAPTKGVWDQIDVLTTKGDLLSQSAAGTYSRVAVGTNGQLLMANSADTSGIGWYDPLNSIYRQAIINGNFDIVQRGISFNSTTTPANNDDTYLLDHWNLISDGNDILDVSQEAITDLPGSTYAIKLDVETSARAGIVQFLEFKDAIKFKGKYVSVSFAVKSANISAIRAAVLSWGSTADTITSDVVGTWGDTPTWATNWTSENTPEDLTVTSSWTTVTINNIYIDSATVNNLALAIWLPNAETIGDIIYISQVQMNAGSIALPFMPKSYGQEYQDCKRYYNRVTGADNQNIGYGAAYSTTAAVIHHFLDVEMRTTPTLEISNVGDFKLSDSTAAYDTTNITLSVITGARIIGLTVTVASGLTQFRPFALNADGTAGRWIAFTSEL